MYDTFINEWGNNVSQVTKFGGQCVALFAEFEAENNLPIVWGNAVDYINNPILLGAYDWVENNPNDPNQVPPRGATVVWNGNLPGSGGYGHIAFYDSPIDAHNFRSYGQNWGGQQAHFQTVPWSYVAGWYVLKESVQQAPTVSEVKPYDVVETYNPAKMVTTNKQPTTKWGMNYDNFQAIEANPITTVDKGFGLYIVEKIHHHGANYDYYREANDVNGWNVLDCDDYFAPVKPYVPPLAPVTAAPAEKYTLLTSLPYYASVDETAKAQTKQGTLQPGTYFVWSKGGSNNIYWELSNSNMTNNHMWVNTIDNKKPLNPPVIILSKPKPSITGPVLTVDKNWRSTKEWFYPLQSGKPDPTKFDEYELQQDVTIRDLEAKGKEFLVFAEKPNSSDNAILKIYGTVWNNGTKYYMLHLPEDQHWQYCYVIPVIQPKTGKPYLLKYIETYDTTPKPREYTASDAVIEGFARLGYKVVDVVRKLQVKIKKL